MNSEPSHVTLAPLIDAHLHLDSYNGEEQQLILDSLSSNGIEHLIAVSMNLASSQHNLELAYRSPEVHPAFGFHPEQKLPSPAELDRLFSWMEEHHDQMIAVGEVGLPYYTRQEAEQKGHLFETAPYAALLERFMIFARRYDKPIVLHAVYEDADTACNLLEKHGVTRAHFHWFKGNPVTVRRMADQGFHISFTPDLLYEEEIQELARQYPEHQVMSETDGPWPFEGPFTGRLTDPAMTADVAAAYAHLKGWTEAEARQLLYTNAMNFYRIGKGS
ncbi:TatD family hydrolase [Paenibacillus sp. JX-17]|uniref:TatD family hydrolase n=1 Tax=Paenibacillus lacisoli TaxID=3064525 RepID=A0ABT9CBY9_9BACL|nr:TatD family hydrolase [Paenibacillus sp. JX-17]MDO7906786.1 TatD family hydrolase [Paenibacillus sp. JX-17]